MNLNEAVVPVLANLPGRAGGGHGGGHSSSGGGSSHSSGISHSSGYVSHGGGGGMGIGGVIFAIIVIIVILVVVRKVRKGGGGDSMGSGTDGFSQPDASASDVAAPPDSLGRALGQAHRSATAAELAEGIAQITAHDPAFDLEALTAGTNRIFFSVQQAWSEKKPAQTRQVMADALWQAHKAQIEGYVTAEQTNRLDGLAVQSQQFVGAGIGGNHDFVIVRFFASSADYVVNDSNGKVVRGHRSVEDWVEDWVFERSSSASTKASGGTLAARCPICSAPLELDLNGSCAFCRSPVSSGAADWVLTRIDQLPSWEWANTNLPR